jgi:hypothetical protein
MKANSPPQSAADTAASMRLTESRGAFASAAWTVMGFDPDREMDLPAIVSGPRALHQKKSASALGYFRMPDWTNSSFDEW